MTQVVKYTMKVKVIKYPLQIFVIWKNGTRKKWGARYTFCYIVLLTLCNGDRRIVYWLFFDKVKNFISGNKWAKVSSSPPRCEKSILLKLATKNCLDQIDHHSPSCLPELHNLAFCEVLQLQFAFDSKGSAARTWQFQTVILPKEVQLHSATLDLILVHNWSWVTGLRQQLNAGMRRMICI